MGAVGMLPVACPPPPRRSKEQDFSLCYCWMERGIESFSLSLSLFHLLPFLLPYRSGRNRSLPVLSSSSNELFASSKAFFFFLSPEGEKKQQPRIDFFAAATKKQLLMSSASLDRGPARLIATPSSTFDSGIIWQITARRSLSASA